MRFFLLILIIVCAPSGTKAETVNIEIKLELISKAQETPLENIENFCKEKSNNSTSSCQKITVTNTEDNISIFEIEDGYVSYEQKLD